MQTSPEAPGKRRQVPSPVSLVCFGKEFADEGEEGRCDLQVNFGLDFAFVPDPDELTHLQDSPEMEMARQRTQENIQQLLGFVRRLERRLPVAKKLLWSESGENLAEKILAGWEQER